MILFNIIQIRPRLVVDILRKNNKALCFCIRHLKFWDEGDEWERFGGKACEACTRDKRISDEIRRNIKKLSITTGWDDAK